MLGYAAGRDCLSEGKYESRGEPRGVHSTLRCALYAEETASCLPGVVYVFLKAGVAPAVKAEISKESSTISKGERDSSDTNLFKTQNLGWLVS